jgi:hypothetical protein
MANLTIQSETTRINFIEYAGDTIKMLFAYKDNLGAFIDLENYEVSMELRKNQEDANAILTYSSANGTVDTTGADANIALEISATQSASLGPGEYFYFIKLAIDTFVNTLIVGKLVLRIR